MKGNENGVTISLCMIVKNEEEVLEKELDGYGEYKKKVKYRLVLFLW